MSENVVHTLANALSHGDQRLLEVGIALAVRPRLLFLDEPTAGMNPVERVKVLENIKHLSADRPSMISKPKKQLFLVAK
ncbi:MAG: hypothetical protein B6240_07130 [Desulfobacteraceae bacterium 4572_87]|nr:MAG: hypothetical protein B6240_07130 [Desulfobacteraceae bacterium 4572_87]